MGSCRDGRPREPALSGVEGSKPSAARPTASAIASLDSFLNRIVIPSEARDLQFAGDQGRAAASLAARSTTPPPALPPLHESTRSGARKAFPSASQSADRTRAPAAPQSENARTAPKKSPAENARSSSQTPPLPGPQPSKNGQ